MGYSVNGACNRMGISEHQGRSLLSDATKSREETSKAIFTEFKRLIDAGYYIDVGQGSEAHLGISTERLRAAVHEAERAGYKLINVRQKQMGTHEKTYMKVLCPPGTELIRSTKIQMILSKSRNQDHFLQAALKCDMLKMVV
mgnify:CR=1 FL=1